MHRWCIVEDDVEEEIQSFCSLLKHVNLVLCEKKLMDRICTVSSMEVSCSGHYKMRRCGINGHQGKHECFC